MSEPQSNAARRTRRRWINFGEFVAFAALIISALGLWMNWQEGKKGPTEVVEKARAIPLVLHAKSADEGRRLAITPVESSHALESLTVTFPGGKAVDLGSDGDLAASAVEAALANPGEREGNGSVTATIDAQYVEAGQQRRAAHKYVLRYRWEGGGLFGGKSLRLTGLARG